MGNILVGTASWTDPTLLKSGWYPPGVSSAEERLKYYATHFPLVEVDSTYYFPPSEANSKLWAERTPEGFKFNIKAFSLLTQHPTKPEAIYKDIRVDTDKKNVYLGDLETKAVDEVWDRFLSALEPLASSNKLGALLFQFPHWFTIGKKNKTYILECAKRAAPYPVCVEFRNKTWMSEDNRAESLEFLEGHGIPYVCVDMPQGFVSSIPPVVAATADLAVMRFHGHNDAEWQSGDVHKRFKYLYSEKELQRWGPQLTELADDASETHVLMNNCYRDYAQQNATDLARLLTDLGASVAK